MRNVTLEMSLKPFKDPAPGAVAEICRALFRQWNPLLKHAEIVSVMLWVGDGSEILDYRGNPDDTFDWGRYVGNANARDFVRNDPEGLCLHSKPRLYIPKPPEFTYAFLRQLTEILKRTGTETTGKPVRVGATFDPGPEFARSSFKYERHPEICRGDSMGKGTMVCCYAVLDADATPYAGFPDGIPAGTTVGTFLGRQARAFLGDLGFDYLWLSNGFGFGLETWGLRGAVFDGVRFSRERCEEIREKNLNFWRDFRRECPQFPIETRGTNLSTGMDLASDAVPWRDIYAGGFGLEPPPNSPWAALNGDFGLELTGWMSHIAEIPGDSFPFRFYTHDPWWKNSPWLDRYGREAHDIYLPLSVCRMRPDGSVRGPSSVEFLTVDDSFGRMPDTVPDEVIPHIRRGLADAPDAPGPLVWVYPFDEYHDMVYGTSGRIADVFFGDWFIRGAINHGLPLNTVVSTAACREILGRRPEVFSRSILVTPLPLAGGEFGGVLAAYAAAGGRILVYGPATGACREILGILGIAPARGLAGDGLLQHALECDTFDQGALSEHLIHPELLSAGGQDAVTADRDGTGTRVLAEYRTADGSRVALASRRTGPGGKIVYVRGTVACDPEKTAGHLLQPFDAARSFPGECLMRMALQEFGIDMRYRRFNPNTKCPVTTIARHRNGLFFSGYCPDSSVVHDLRFPAGAPVFTGCSARVGNGRARYTFPAAWHRECRVFVNQQQPGVVSCREHTAERMDLSRRLLLTGCTDALVRFLPEPGTEHRVTFLRNPAWPFVTGDFADAELSCGPDGTVLTVAGVNGDLLISW